MTNNLPTAKGDNAAIVRASFRFPDLVVVSSGPYGIKLRTQKSMYYGTARPSLKNRLSVGDAVHVLIDKLGHIACDVRHIGKNTVTLRRSVAVENPEAYTTWQRIQHHVKVKSNPLAAIEESRAETTS